jgi:hypothetical protein
LLTQSEVWPEKRASDFATGVKQQHLQWCPVVKVIDLRSVEAVEMGWLIRLEEEIDRARI